LYIAQRTEWLTLAEAASHASRSYSWARDRAASGAFISHPDRAPCIRVSAESVAQVIARDRREQRRGAPANRPHLRLIVDNTK
jgi:hypothetical protein